MFSIFSQKKQSLIHGADIFAEYLNNDKSFVEQVEREGEAQAIFTFQFVIKALKYRFPKNSKPLIYDFIKMLAFDAIVGNNDRHYYNWGVISHIDGKVEPVFSPIFDTARGLFWNTTDEKISSYFENGKKLDKYIKNCRPKTGWNTESKDLNHFDLMQFIAKKHDYYSCLKSIPIDDLLPQATTILDNEFTDYMIPNRRDLIKECLRRRTQKFQSILKV